MNEIENRRKLSKKTNKNLIQFSIIELANLTSLLNFYLLLFKFCFFIFIFHCFLMYKNAENINVFVEKTINETFKAMQIIILFIYQCHTRYPLQFLFSFVSVLFFFLFISFLFSFFIFVSFLYFISAGFYIMYLLLL